MQAVEPGFVEQTTFQKLYRTVKATMRFCYATRQDKSLRYVSLALIAGNPVAKRVFVFDDTGGKMWHHGVTFGSDAFCRGYHILNRCALDVGDIDPGTQWQQVAKAWDFLGGAGMTSIE